MQIGVVAKRTGLSSISGLTTALSEVSSGKPVERGREARRLDWDRADAASPAYVREFGPLTSVAEGSDVAGAIADDPVDSCRLYPVSGDGFDRAPMVKQIARVLRIDRVAPL